MASINYSVGSNWGSGFIGTMTVPGGDSGLHGWTIEFDADFDITNIWGATIVSHGGGHYVISNAAWNANVAAGSQASFGFQATAAAGGTAVSGLVLDGAGTTAPPPPLPTLSIADSSVAEGNAGTAQLSFTVTLSQAAAGPVTVHYATVDGTATAGSDYTAQAGTLSFAAGETSKTVTVAVTGDTAVEANETLSISLSAASGATIAQATATGTIVNDDVAPPPPPPSGGTSVDYSIVSNWGSGFTAAIRVGGGSGGLDGWTVGFDSTATIGSVWGARILSHVGNHYVIGNEEWNAHVGAGAVAIVGFQATTTGGNTAATGFTVNDIAAGHDPAPPLPTLSVADASASEGNSGVQDLAFTVNLSTPATSAVTVAYATTDGSAKAGSDYTATSGTITFAPGQTSSVVHVQVAGDSAVESNETLTLTLSSPNGATIGDGTAAGTIINDDVAPPPPPQLPGLTISNTSVVEGTPGTGGTPIVAGWLSTSGNQIVDAAGQSVQIAGVNWFGFESSNLAPHGLWTRGYKDMMNQMVSLGFNTIRLPFSSEMLHTAAAPNGIDFSKNPDLQGLSALQVMDKIVDYAGQVGLKIILDHHRSDSGAGTSANGLWYDANHSQAQWIADWQMLAERYADDPQVIGADLHNEPYNGTWGDGGPNDWAAAATAAGDAIGTVNPNWLIFVEGIGTYQGQSYWWGGNLMGVKDHPIVLDQPNKLVYSAHDYPNSVWPQSWFQGSDFPANLPAKFDQMWGYIYKQNIAPVYVGEFGTNLTDPKDAPWLQAIAAYLGGDLNNDGTSDIPAGQKGPSWTFWSWNPNSGDTGGILQNDWSTVNQNKLNYLTPIEFSFDSSSVTPGSNAAVFQLTLSQPATGAVTVNFHTVAGDADSNDFTPTSGSVTFAPGQQTQTISIPVTADALNEPNEHFTVVLTNATGATITSGTGSATIVNDDGAATSPVTPPTTPPDAPATSGGLGGQVTVTDTWSGGFNASVDVHNGGTSTTTGWQLEIDMPYQITNIWNATIVSHDASGYVIASAPYNGRIGANGDTSFGFTANGQVDQAAIRVHGIDPQGTTSVTTPPVTPIFTPDPSHMFSPYIDMAMPQDADLVAISQASGIQNFTLAFMLASPQGIGWQGQGTIADDTLANGSTILQQVQAIQALGGNITISFGGAAGQEAALTATNATTLQAEYQSVIDRYQIDSIDFDIEGAAELDQRSLHLRDQAIVGLQAANPDLRVSFTLPVLPTGLDASGLNVLQTAKNDGVRIDVVNIMAMDYGQSVDNNGQMGQNAISAVTSTEHQLAEMGLVAKVGVTPMIGVNDIASEVFTLADAQSLVDYAKTDSQLALLSMWSVARDNGGGAGSHAAAPDNSGVAQQSYQYAGILHQFDRSA